MKGKRSTKKKGKRSDGTNNKRSSGTGRKRSKGMKLKQYYYDGTVINGVANDGLLDESQKQQFRNIFNMLERVKLFKIVTTKTDPTFTAAGGAGRNTYSNIFLCKVGSTLMIFDHHEKYLGGTTIHNIINYELSDHQPSGSGAIQEEFS